jgi:hypothetical protein
MKLIDYLIRSYNTPYYFGLGFIVLKNKHSKLHFYNKELLPTLVDDIHNHRFDFESTILLGRLDQKIFKWESTNLNNATHIKTYEDCKANSTTKPPDKEYGKIFHTLNTSTDSSYSIKADTYHSISTSDKCVTSLTKTSVERDFASVLRPINGEIICPYSNNIPEKECWQIIEETLDGS